MPFSHLGRWGKIPFQWTDPHCLGVPGVRSTRVAVAGRRGNCCFAGALSRVATIIRSGHSLAFTESHVVGKCRHFSGGSPEITALDRPYPPSQTRVTLRCCAERHGVQTRFDLLPALPRNVPRPAITKQAFISNGWVEGCKSYQHSKIVSSLISCRVFSPT